MKLTLQEPPRVFTAGREPVTLSHVADLDLQPDELVTFTTPAGGAFDVSRKAWGFYATPSLNGRLKGAGLRACLAEGEGGKRFILLVERGCEASFLEYLQHQSMVVLFWLDGDAPLTKA